MASKYSPDPAAERKLRRDTNWFFEKYWECFDCSVLEILEYKGKESYGPPELKCQLCLGLNYPNAILDCGHVLCTFCYKVNKKVFKNKCNDIECGKLASDKEKLEKEEIFPKLFKITKLKCFRNNCTFIGKFTEVIEHFRNCIKREVSSGALPRHVLRKPSDASQQTSTSEQTSSTEQTTSFSEPSTSTGRTGSSGQSGSSGQADTSQDSDPSEQPFSIQRVSPRKKSVSEKYPCKLIAFCFKANSQEDLNTSKWEIKTFSIASEMDCEGINVPHHPCRGYARYNGARNEISLYFWPLKNYKGEPKLWLPPYPKIIYDFQSQSKLYTRQDEILFGERIYTNGAQHFITKVDTFIEKLKADLPFEINFRWVNVYENEGIKGVNGVLDWKVDHLRSKRIAQHTRHDDQLYSSYWLSRKEAYRCRAALDFKDEAKPFLRFYVLTGIEDLDPSKVWFGFKVKIYNEEDATKNHVKKYILRAPYVSINLANLLVWQTCLRLDKIKMRLKFLAHNLEQKISEEKIVF